MNLSAIFMPGRDDSSTGSPVGDERQKGSDLVGGLLAPDSGQGRLGLGLRSVMVPLCFCSKVSSHSFPLVLLLGDFNAEILS